MRRRHSENLADVRRGHLHDLAQHERGPRRRRQFGQASRQSPPECRAVQRIHARREPVRRRLGPRSAIRERRFILGALRGIRDSGTASQRAKVIDDLSFEDRDQPRSYASLAAMPGRIPEGGDERLLHEVFRNVPASDAAQRVGAKHVAVLIQPRRGARGRRPERRSVFNRAFRRISFRNRQRSIPSDASPFRSTPCLVSKRDHFPGSAPRPPVRDPRARNRRRHASDRRVRSLREPSFVLTAAGRRQ
ncbi:MAG: hypothetical protein FLDDKLPJ_00877 [Phycisphaerae bacterium]|nr:hypothetical protein [Phycisphaerae bacterium]